MGIALLMLVLLSAIVLIAYAVRKRKNASRKILASLLAFAAISVTLFCLYLSPYTIQAPSNPAVMVMTSKSNAWVEDDGAVADIMALLEPLELKRELIPYNGNFSNKITNVGADDYFIIMVYDNDNVSYEMPKHVGDYCFIISSYGYDTFTLPGSNNRNKSNVLDSGDAKDEIYEIIQAFVEF